MTDSVQDIITNSSGLLNEYVCIEVFNLSRTSL